MVAVPIFQSPAKSKVFYIFLQDEGIVSIYSEIPHYQNDFPKTVLVSLFLTEIFSVKFPLNFR